MKQKSKDTHCILPYIHLYAEPTGLVKPCCIGGEFKEELSLRNKSVEEVREIIERENCDIEDFVELDPDDYEFV